MGLIATREAAQRAGISVQAWHRLMDRLGIKPAAKVPGVTGAKMWSPEDVRSGIDALAAADETPPHGIARPEMVEMSPLGGDAA